MPLVVEGPHAEVGSNSVYVLDVACAPSLGRAGSAAANSASSTNVDMYVLAGSDGNAEAACHNRA